MNSNSKEERMHHDCWIRQSKAVLQQADTDFFEVRPARFWFDFLLSMTIAYTTASIYLLAPLFSIAQIIALPIAVFWLYRVSSLVHEVAHLSHREMRVFKVAWNLLVGVMILSPSPFFTRHHRDHHSARMYGTREDPEYIANVFQPGSLLSLLGYAALAAAFPVIVFLRFLLAPLTFAHPKLRAWVLERASSLTMNWHYRRKLNRFDRWAITGLEALCCLRAWTMLLVVFTGAAPPYRLALLYVLGVSTLALNQLRLMGDHHLESEGHPLDMATHVQDSCNYTSRDFLTWLLFPFSIRYHALHHLFPTLPYHNLAAAHAYLLSRLPANSPYRALDEGSWWNVARGVLDNRRNHGAERERESGIGLGGN
jgi:fatty acid desaturase